MAAPFLSRRTREFLEEGGVGYLDLTGNARLVASRPGLSTTARLLEVAEEAARSGVEVEVRDYIAPISDGA